MRGGGLGSRPKKMYGERLGDGVEYHLMSPTPIIKYHLRRGVGLIKFLENCTRPQSPTSPPHSQPELSSAATQPVQFQIFVEKVHRHCQHIGRFSEVQLPVPTQG